MKHCQLHHFFSYFDKHTRSSIKKKVDHKRFSNAYSIHENKFNQWTCHKWKQYEACMITRIHFPASEGISLISVTFDNSKSSLLSDAELSDSSSASPVSIWWRIQKTVQKKESKKQHRSHQPIILHSVTHFYPSNNSNPSGHYHSKGPLSASNHWLK